MRQKFYIAGRWLHASGLLIALWTCDCEDMQFVPSGNARDLHVLCLMTTDGLGLEIRRYNL